MTASTSTEVVLLVVLISCATITGVLANCINTGTSVEERTRRVPLVIKGIVDARSHTGTYFNIRVGKILKGGNESVSRTDIELVIVNSQESTSEASPTTGLTSNATTTVTDTQGTATSSNEQATASQPPAAPCLHGVGVFERYIFFLRPLDDSGMLFEVSEDGVPQTRDNLRRIRQTVRKDEGVNETLPEDDHSGPCIDPTYVDHYCLNGGTCGVWRGVEQYFCICNYPYHGQRCGEVDPALDRSDEPGSVPNGTTMAIAVIMSAFFIVTVICAVAYIKYKNSVWRERKRDVEKTLKYMQERYPSRPSSRRESPIEGVLRLKPNSTKSDNEGAPQVVIFQDADGKHSRQGSLSSTQYRLFTEVQSQPYRANEDRTEHSPRDSRTSVV